jgi:hypothetical protein
MATHARGRFKMAFMKVGPTELRILLAAGTIQLMRSDVVTLFGHQWLLFDVGGAVAIAGTLMAFAANAIQNGIALYKAERLYRFGAVKRAHAASEPRERSAPVRRARERAGESEGQTPSDRRREAMMAS